MKLKIILKNYIIANKEKSEKNLTFICNYYYY